VSVVDYLHIHCVHICIESRIQRPLSHSSLSGPTAAASRLWLWLD